MLSNKPIRIVVVFLFLLKVWLCFLIANKNLFVVTIKVWLKLPENKHVRFADIAPTRICVLIVLMKTSRVTNTANQTVFVYIPPIRMLFLLLFYMKGWEQLYREPIRIENQLDSLRSHCSNGAISTNSHSNCFADILQSECFSYFCFL